MTDATIDAFNTISRPYGVHAAARDTGRTVIPAELKGRGAHRSEKHQPEREPLAVSAPFLALVSFLAVLAVAIGVALSLTSSASDYVNDPAPSVAEYEAGLSGSCGDYCGSDAGLITQPAN